MVKQQHQVFVALLVAIDASVVVVAAFAAWAPVRLNASNVGDWPFFPPQWETYFKEPLLFVVVPVYLLFLWACRLYRARRDGSIWHEWGQIVRACTLAIGAVVLLAWLVGNDLVGGRSTLPDVEFFGRTFNAGRFQLSLLALASPLLLITHRTVFRATLRALRRRGWNQRHVAIIGNGRLGQIACLTLERNSWTGIKPIYFISHRDETNRKSCLDRPVEGGLEALEEVLERRPVDAVYIAIPNSSAARMPEILRRLERFSLEVRVIPDVPPRYVAMGMTISELEGMPILSYRESPIYGLGGFGKRLVDLGGALLALVLFTPLMIPIALAVRLSGPGPIIFKQRRVSLGGDQFKIYKFRTMRHVEDESATPAWTERDDPRVTPVGRLLRRTSLDELPQLINVINGDMSLVGPRPERPELIERFRDDWRGYMLRQHVKAGITGWAQVNGLRGNTSLRKRLQYDLFYIKHWSIWFDLRILWLTLFRGFAHRNAH